MNHPYHLFVDESGKPDLLDKRYDDFILTGVLIADIELPTISGYFSFIKRKYKLPENSPFHTYDLLENPHSQNRLRTRQMSMFIESMKEFLQLIPLKVVTIYTNKPNFMTTYQIKDMNLRGTHENKERNGIVYRLSSLILFQRVSRLLGRKQKNCAIHADSRKYLDSQLLKAFIDLKEPTLSTRLGTRRNPYAQLARYLCSIEFANKMALSGGLELTDFISYISFAFVRNNLGRLHVDTVWPNIRRNMLNRNFIKIPQYLGKRYV